MNSRTGEGNDGWVIVSAGEPRPRRMGARAGGEGTGVRESSYESRGGWEEDGEEDEVGRKNELVEGGWPIWKSAIAGSGFDEDASGSRACRPTEVGSKSTVW